MDEQKTVRPAQGEKTSDEEKKPKKKTGDGSDDSSGNNDGMQGRERTRDEDIRRKRAERMKGLPTYEEEQTDRGCESPGY